MIVDMSGKRVTAQPKPEFRPLLAHANLSWLDIHGGELLVGLVTVLIGVITLGAVGVI